VSSAERSGATRLYLVEDHAVVREGLRMLLQAAGMQVVGAAASATEAIPELARTRPDVVLLDVDLGDEDGIELLPRIRDAAPHARVLVLTALRDPGHAVAALRGGASGLVHKESEGSVVVRAVRAAAAGRRWFAPEILQASAAAGRPASEPPAALTDRERDLVGLVGEGLRNEEIARRLGVTEKTVRNQLTAIFEKLGVAGRLELAVFAYRHGIARIRR
jgi:DNA-binding NarL/FixJ family response regulator